MNRTLPGPDIELSHVTAALSCREASSFASSCRWSGYAPGQFDVTVLHAGAIHGRESASLRLIRVIERSNGRERLYRDYITVPWLDSFERDLQSGLFEQSWQFAWE